MYYGIVSANESLLSIELLIYSRLHVWWSAQGDSVVYVQVPVIPACLLSQENFWLVFSNPFLCSFYISALPFLQQMCVL